MILLNLGAPEIILIVLAVLILFGGKKIPELMRGLGENALVAFMGFFNLYVGCEIFVD